MGKVILNPEETEFNLGLLLVGATRKKDISGPCIHEPFPKLSPLCPDWQKEKPGS
jgi:hypothetical protein